MTCFCHACRPRHHPDLQTLRESCHWDSVIVSGIPEVPSALEPPARVSTEVNRVGTTPTSSQETPLGSPNESGNATPDALGIDVTQTDLADVDAKSMLILGLRGQNHDPERYFHLM